METDALNRRLRFAKPQPVGERITVHDADMIVFEALHRHGPLPTHYLHEFAKHLSKNRNAFQCRCKGRRQNVPDGGVIVYQSG